MIHKCWSREELKKFLKITSSIDHRGNIHPRAILDRYGKPIPSSNFQKITGAWNLVTPVSFEKNEQEKLKIKRVKRAYKKNMKKKKKKKKV